MSDQRTLVNLEKTLESPLDCKEIQPVHSEGDQPWDFFGGNDAEAETPVILEPRKIKSATVSTVSPSICHEVMGPDAMILVF